MRGRPPGAAEVAWALGGWFAAAVGVSVGWLLGASASGGDGGFQFGSKHLWFGALGVSWHLGVDGISLFLLVLSGILFPIALIGARPGPCPCCDL